jgi:DNA-binding MarR family transcriptional regulator
MTPPRKSAAAHQALVDEALRNLRGVVSTLSTSARQLEARTGITNAQLFVLQALDRARTPLSITQLQEHVRSGQSAVSLVVARLAAAGLVTRDVSAADRRVRVVALTARGAKLARRGPTPPTARVLAALAEMEPANLKALARGLEALATAVGAPTADPPPMFEVLPAEPRRRR